MLKIDTIVKWKWWLFGLIFLAGAVSLLERWLTQRENRHDPLILAAARKYGVDPALVKAVIWRESKFDPDTRGRADEVGLMQLRADAAREGGQSSLHDIPRKASLRRLSPVACLSFHGHLPPSGVISQTTKSSTTTPKATPST